MTKIVLRIFNTLTRKKEVFKPIKKGLVHMYTCGPTVYAVPHTGNYRSFMLADVIQRYLEYLGYRVKHVMNITDIDDKTIAGSAEEGLSLKEFTKKYTKQFFKGLDMLNIKRAFSYPRASENVDEMIKVTKSLIEKEYAYVKFGSVYFDISRFKDYGKLSRVDLSKIKPGARVDVDEYAKKNPRDFVLMKRSKLPELKRGIYYKTEWGNVRPGWHMECSAISMKYLGETFDIHTGGVDLVFPHHENEIAQSEAHTEKKFVNYWVHGEHLLVDGQKMAKSLGNCIAIEDVVEKYGSEVIRYMFLSTNYKKKLNYTEKFADNVKRNYEKLKETFNNLKFSLKSVPDTKTESDKEFLKKLPRIREQFIQAMDDNLNTPLALGVLHELSKEINKHLKRKGNRKTLRKAFGLFKEISDVFGLEFKDVEEKLQQEVQKLIEEREDARKRKEWKTADEIRKKLEEMGIILEDMSEGVRWKKKYPKGR